MDVSKVDVDDEVNDVADEHNANIGNDEAGDFADGSLCDVAGGKDSNAAEYRKVKSLRVKYKSRLALGFSSSFCE